MDICRKMPQLIVLIPTWVMVRQEQPSGLHEWCMQPTATEELRDVAESQEELGSPMVKIENRQAQIITDHWVTKFDKIWVWI